MINIGEYYCYKGDYGEAVYFYEKAFSEFPHIFRSKDMLYMAKCKLMLGDTVTSFRYITKSSNFLGFVIQRDSILYNTFLHHPLYKDSIARCMDHNKQIAIAQSKGAAGIFAEIDSLVAIDQQHNQIRQQIGTDQKDYPKEDSLFYEDYYNYIRENGYPGFWLSGTDVLAVLNVHIWPGEQTLRFNELFREEYEKGNMESAAYAMFLDRRFFETYEQCGLGMYSGRFCSENLDDNYLIIIQNRFYCGYSPFFKSPRQYFMFNMDETSLIPYLEKIDFKKWF